MVKSAVHVQDLALHHLHDLPYVSANAVLYAKAFILHLTDSCSHTFTPSSVTTVERSSNEDSREKGYHTTGSELIFSRLVASLSILASGESMCCLVVIVYWQNTRRLAGSVVSSPQLE